MRRLFTQNYSLMVASKVAADGSRHVGWIDRQGVFTDVTAFRQPASDFSSTVSDDTPMFGDDGSFYFATRAPSSSGYKNKPTVMKTTVANPSDIITAPDQSDITSNDVNYIVQPSGRIEGLEALSFVFFESGVEGRGGWRVWDWIDETHYVFVDDDSMISRAEAQNRQDLDPFDLPHTDLIPETNRTVWSPVVSPDGKLIAFLSSDIGGAVDIFIVPSNGGEPKKLTPDESSISSDLVLLEWAAEGSHLEPTGRAVEVATFPPSTEQPAIVSTAIAMACTTPSQPDNGAMMPSQERLNCEATVISDHP
jgi:hypothetical protein